MRQSCRLEGMASKCVKTVSTGFRVYGIFETSKKCITLCLKPSINHHLLPSMRSYLVWLLYSSSTPYSLLSGTFGGPASCNTQIFVSSSSWANNSKMSLCNCLEHETSFDHMIKVKTRPCLLLLQMFYGWFQWPWGKCWYSSS